MDIFDLLGNDDRIIVMSIADERLLYTWNKEDTFECWSPVDLGTTVNFEGSSWQAKSKLVKKGNAPKTLNEAKRVVEAWHYNSR